MSHARRREGADVPKGYKEEPAPVADDLVSVSLVILRLFNLVLRPSFVFLVFSTSVAAYLCICA